MMTSEIHDFPDMFATSDRSLVVGAFENDDVFADPFASSTPNTKKEKNSDEKDWTPFDDNDEESDADFFARLSNARVAQQREKQEPEKIIEEGSHQHHHSHHHHQHHQHHQHHKPHRVRPCHSDTPTRGGTRRRSHSGGENKSSDTTSLEESPRRHRSPRRPPSKPDSPARPSRSRSSSPRLHRTERSSSEHAEGEIGRSNTDLSKISRSSPGKTHKGSTEASVTSANTTKSSATSSSSSSPRRKLGGRTHSAKSSRSANGSSTGTSPARGERPASSPRRIASAKKVVDITSNTCVEDFVHLLDENDSKNDDIHPHNDGGVAVKEPKSRSRLSRSPTRDRSQVRTGRCRSKETARTTQELDQSVSVASHEGGSPSRSPSRTTTTKTELDRSARRDPNKQRPPPRRATSERFSRSSRRHHRITLSHSPIRDASSCDGGSPTASRRLKRAPRKEDEEHADAEKHGSRDPGLRRPAKSSSPPPPPGVRRTLSSHVPSRGPALQRTLSAHAPRGPTLRRTLSSHAPRGGGGAGHWARGTAQIQQRQLLSGIEANDTKLEAGGDDDPILFLSLEKEPVTSKRKKTKPPSPPVDHSIGDLFAHAPSVIEADIRASFVSVSSALAEAATKAADIFGIASTHGGNSNNNNHNPSDGGTLGETKKTTKFRTSIFSGKSKVIKGPSILGKGTDSEESSEEFF